MKTDSAKKSKRISLDELRDYRLPHIIFNSCHEVLIEGSKGIIEYSEKTVRLNSGNFILKFCGDSLCIRALTTDEIIITGDILLFEFCSV